MYCRICGNEMKKIEQIDCINDYVILTDKPHKLNVIENDLYLCKSCKHMQIKPVIATNYYDDNVLMENSHFTFLKDNKKRKIEKLKKYSPDDEKCLDIGCGQGDVLLLASEYYKKCIGIEPAKNNYSIADKKIEEFNKKYNKHDEIINGYFGYEMDKKLNDFSAFYAIMVFEHLENLTEAMENAYDCLKDGGVGLINVPNGQKIYNNNLYWMFINEHINYFTPQSLAKLAEKCGFEVLEINTNEYENEDLLEIDLYVRKGKKHYGFSAAKQNCINRLDKYLEGSNNIVIWGAGNRAHTYSWLLRDKYDIKHIIDSCENKKGKYVCGINRPIEVVNKKIIENSDTIIIFASTFNKNILHELENKYRYKGKIIYFENGDVLSK